MYFVLKALIRSLILPPAGPLILALVGVCLLWRQRRGGWAFLATGVASLWLLCTPIVADQITRVAERYPPLDLRQPVNAQAIVIIGGGQRRTMAPEYGGPVADTVLLERLAYGAYLARRTSLPILVSGAPGEVVAMSTTLSRNFGIQVRWVEGQSLDTYENARLSAHILQPQGIKHIVLVTSSTHLWRAAHEFMDAGFEVVPAPSGVLAKREEGVFTLIPGPAALWRSNAALYELLGEPMRRLQAALGVREKLDRKAG